MSRKAKKPEFDLAVQAANTTSRRGLIGVISAAVIAAVGAISAAGINNCGNLFKPGPSPSPTRISFIGRVIDEKTEAKIRGAKVSLESESVPSVAYSDSEGIFSFPVTDPNKEMRLRIEANQYENYDLRTTPAKNQGIQDVRLTPKTDKTEGLSGTVLDRNDKPNGGGNPPEGQRQPVKTQKVDTKFFTFELLQCRLSGASVICDLRITNNGRDRRLRIGDRSMMFDDHGNQSYARLLRLANSKDSNDVISLLVSSVPTLGSLTFEEVSPQSTRITLLEVQCSYESDIGFSVFEGFKVQFRNICLTCGSPKSHM